VLSPAIFPERLPADVEGDPVLRAIDRLHFLPVLALGAFSYWYGGWLFLGAFFLSNTLQFHATATVNSLSHLFGCRPFLTDDDSRNNSLVAVLNLGEGWHNLHHAFPFSCRHGFTVSDGTVKRLLDPTFSFIRLLSRFGLASDLQVPSDAILLSKSSSVAVN
jgi:stearoyl-CoA desaturase (delta-9 desaturase)